jgi:hypothetical protein
MQTLRYVVVVKRDRARFKTRQSEIFFSVGISYFVLLCLTNAHILAMQCDTIQSNPIERRDGHKTIEVFRLYLEPMS